MKRWKKQLISFMIMAALLYPQSQYMAEDNSLCQTADETQESTENSAPEETENDDIQEKEPREDDAQRSNEPDTSTDSPALSADEENGKSDSPVSSDDIADDEPDNEPDEPDDEPDELDDKTNIETNGLEEQTDAADTPIYSQDDLNEEYSLPKGDTTEEDTTQKQEMDDDENAPEGLAEDLGLSEGPIFLTTYGLNPNEELDETSERIQITIPPILDISDQSAGICSFSISTTGFSTFTDAVSVEVKVTSQNGYVLNGEQSSLFYELYSGNSDSALKNGDTVACFTGDGTWNLKLKILDELPSSGRYTDTLTFTMSIVEGENDGA